MVETCAFGETLKRAREERGIPLEAAASATRIARHHLDALERGDLESLPSGPFGRSYLRSYAEFLGLEPEPILDSYRSQEADKGLGPDESRERAMRQLAQLLDRRPKPGRIRLLPVIAVLVAASALSAVSWVRWVGRGTPEVVPEKPPVEKVAAAMMPASPPPQEPAPQPDPAKEPPTPHPVAGAGAAAALDDHPGASAITVSEAALGTDVVNHALTGRGTRFSEGERVAFWTRVLAAKPGDVIHHYWFYEGRAVMRADLSIGGPHWRTFSRYTLPEGSKGTWVVEARDRTGRVLAREEFLCLERGG
jgi:cytoskeletal protein RodZ